MLDICSIYTYFKLILVVLMKLERLLIVFFNAFSYMTLELIPDRIRSEFLLLTVWAVPVNNNESIELIYPYKRIQT